MVALAAIAGLLLCVPGLQAQDTLFVEESFFGSFGNAARIAVDASGTIYVLDDARHTLSLFSERGTHQRLVGGYGWDATTLDRPTGVATDGLTIYVSDYGNHRIVRYDRNLVFLSALSTRDTSISSAQFGYPLGLALSKQGDLFVLDGENLRVVQFDSRSGFVRSFGSLEAGEGRLQRPLEVAVSEDDKVLVLEPDRIAQFDYAGNFLSSIGRGTFTGAKGMAVGRRGIMVVANDTLHLFDSKGSVRWAMAASEILSEYSLAPLQDVAMWKDRLLIVSPSRVGIFRMEPASR